MDLEQSVTVERAVSLHVHKLPILSICLTKGSPHDRLWYSLVLSGSRLTGGEVLFWEHLYIKCLEIK